MLYPFCALKDVLSFNAYMIKEDVKNAINTPFVTSSSKSSSSSKSKQEPAKTEPPKATNINVDVHIHEDNTSRQEPVKEDTVVAEQELREVVKEDTGTAESPEVNVEEKTILGPDFSNAENITIPQPGVIYEEEAYTAETVENPQMAPSTENENLKTVTPEALEQAIAKAKNK